MWPIQFEIMVRKVSNQPLIACHRTNAITMEFSLQIGWITSKRFPIGAGLRWKITKFPLDLKRDQLKIAESTIWDLLTCSLQCDDYLVQKSSMYYQCTTNGKQFKSGTNATNLAMCGEQVSSTNCPSICCKTISGISWQQLCNVWHHMITQKLLGFFWGVPSVWP